MSFMLSGLRNIPMTENHMRVLEIVGEEAPSKKAIKKPAAKKRIIDLTEEPSTSSGIYMPTGPFLQLGQRSTAAAVMRGQQSNTESRAMMTRPSTMQPSTCKWTLSLSPPLSLLLCLIVILNLSL